MWWIKFMFLLIVHPNSIYFEYRMWFRICNMTKKIILPISKKHKLLNTYIKVFKKNPYAKIFENKYQKRPNYWLQTLVLNNNILHIRNTLLNKANSKNIMLRPVWKLMYKLPHLYKYPKMDLTTSLKLEKKLINLPSSIYI